MGHRTFKPSKMAKAYRTATLLHPIKSALINLELAIEDSCPPIAGLFTSRSSNCANFSSARQSIVDQSSERLYKSFHQTSTQEYLVWRCLTFGYTPSLVTLRAIPTLQKSVHNMDDTDKEPASNLCGHCGSFVFAQLHKPVPSQYKILSLFLLALANKNRCPVLTSNPSRSRTIP